MAEIQIDAITDATSINDGDKLLGVDDTSPVSTKLFDFSDISDQVISDLGVASGGDADKYLNEQGDFIELLPVTIDGGQTITGDKTFTGSVTIGDTSALDLKLLSVASESNDGKQFLQIDALGNVSKSSSTMSSGHTIQDDGIDVTDRTNLSFDAPLTVTDNSANDRTEIGLSLTEPDIPNIPFTKVTGQASFTQLSTDTPSGGQVLTYNTGGTMEWTNKTEATVTKSSIDTAIGANANDGSATKFYNEQGSFVEINNNDSTGIVEYSDSDTYSDGEVVWFNDDDKIYVWTSSTDSVAGNSPSDDTTNWLNIGGGGSVNAEDIGDGTLGDGVLVADQNSDNGFKYWYGTQSEYDGLSSYDDDTIYMTDGDVTGYTLPAASASTLGGIKIGTGLSIDDNGVVTTNSASSEGTWTPSFLGYTGSEDLTTSNTSYVKIGPMVVVNCTLSIPSNLSDGDVRLDVDSLPFEVQSGFSINGVWFGESRAGAVNAYSVRGMFSNEQSVGRDIVFYHGGGSDDGTQVALVDVQYRELRGNSGGNGMLYFSFTYITSE